jgi:hypothetical protein
MVTDSDLTSLERAVLHEIYKQMPIQDQESFKAQLEGISVQNRKNTGGGFFTYFAVKNKRVPKILADTKNYCVGAKIRGLEHGFSFILWLKEGCVDFLEGYANGPESTAKMDLAALKFEIIPSTFSN